MATLTIRNLPERVRDRLRVRAAKRGVSMEEEVRGILADAVEARGKPLPPTAIKQLQQWVASQRQHPDDGEGSAALIRDRRRETILEVVQAGEDPQAVFGDNYRRVLAEAGWSAKFVQNLARQQQ